MQSDTNRACTSGKSQNVSSSEPKSVLQRLLEYFLALLVGGIVILLAAQVAVRHVAGGSLPWSGEMATWLFSWSTFIGAVLVYMEKKHIVIDFLIAFLPEKTLRILNNLLQLVIIAVLVVLFVTGIKITMLYSNQTATSIEISKALLFVSLPISSALMIGWSVYGWFSRRG